MLHLGLLWLVVYVPAFAMGNIPLIANTKFVDKAYSRTQLPTKLLWSITKVYHPEGWHGELATGSNCWPAILSDPFAQNHFAS
jgi:hypothetical protein